MIEVFVVDGVRTPQLGAANQAGEDNDTSVGWRLTNPRFTEADRQVLLEAL